MKNWIILLLIFVMPLSLYAYLDVKAQNNKVCTVKEENQIKNSKLKIIKFSSPMCSECKQMEQELTKAMETNKDVVIFEEINVIDNSRKNAKYNKNAIKKYNVTLVPTTVFISKDGNIIKRQEGLMKSEEIIEIINGAK